MKDFYLEQLIKRKNTKRTAFFKFLLVVGAIVTLPLIVFSPFFILAPIFLALIAISIFKITNVEYEYIYFNGNFDIDKVMAKQFRRHILSTNFHEIEVIAPTGSLEVQQYKKVKAYDFSSRKKGHATYQMVVNHKGKRGRIIFEPSEELLTEMKLAAPRKVYF